MLLTVYRLAVLVRFMLQLHVFAVGYFAIGLSSGFVGIELDFALFQTVSFLGITTPGTLGIVDPRFVKNYDFCVNFFANRAC